MAMTTLPVAVFSCSPRSCGNTDTATDILVEALRNRGIEHTVVALREYELMPCRGCNHCGMPGKGCVLSRADDCNSLLKLLYTAPAVFWLAPIFFYHLPAQSKALIDRTQAYWHLKRGRDPEILALSSRKAHILLIAARSRGAKLFEGSLASLRYFFEVFNIGLAEPPLLLTGLDGQRDLRDSAEQCERIAAWSAAALEK